LSDPQLELAQCPHHSPTIRQMAMHAKTSIIRLTMAVMGRSSIAKNLGLAKFLIDANEHLPKSGARSH
jgi:hypothetical protein